jgi:membrane-associated protease RseP (regulator of RpoE activity)
MKCIARFGRRVLARALIAVALTVFALGASRRADACGSGGSNTALILLAGPIAAWDLAYLTGAAAGSVGGVVQSGSDISGAIDGTLKKDAWQTGVLLGSADVALGILLHQRILFYAPDSASTLGDVANFLALCAIGSGALSIVTAITAQLLAPSEVELEPKVVPREPGGPKVRAGLAPTLIADSKGGLAPGLGLTIANF